MDSAAGRPRTDGGSSRPIPEPDLDGSATPGVSMTTSPRIQLLGGSNDVNGRGADGIELDSVQGSIASGRRHPQLGLAGRLRHQRAQLRRGRLLRRATSATRPDVAQADPPRRSREGRRRRRHFPLYNPAASPSTRIALELRQRLPTRALANVSRPTSPSLPGGTPRARAARAAAAQASTFGREQEGSVNVRTSSHRARRLASSTTSRASDHDGQSALSPTRRRCKDALHLGPRQSQHGVVHRHIDLQEPLRPRHLAQGWRQRRLDGDRQLT